MQVSPIKFEKFQAADDADCQRRIIAAREKLGKAIITKMRRCIATRISQVIHSNFHVIVKA